MKKKIKGRKVFYGGEFSGKRKGDLAVGSGAAPDAKGKRKRHPAAKNPSNSESSLRGLP